MLTITGNCDTIRPWKGARPQRKGRKKMGYIVWKVTAENFEKVAELRNAEVARIFTDLSNGWNEAGVRYEYTKADETPVW